MKLVVDIPDDVYESVKNTKTIETVDYDIVSLYRATKNGKPVSTDGDLISRENLKKAIDKLFESGGYDSGLVMDMIDNAPTVEYPFYQEAYQTGYEEGKNERPQGEWEESHIISCGKILQMQLDVIEHKCKNCGRWSIKWVRTIPDNFCPNCGAEMRGEKE